jgi:hypothetical protein
MTGMARKIRRNTVGIVTVTMSRRVAAKARQGVIRKVTPL